MMNLEAEKVIKAWPGLGQAAVVDLKDCLPEHLASMLDDPKQFLLPKTELPERHRGSKLWASEAEWERIVKAGYDRGMFVPVDDADVPRDRKGHLISNGAGAVSKTKVVNGVTQEAQRFISILCPLNDAMRLLPGAQDTLPYVGQLTAILAEQDSYLVMDSEDLQSAFNLFRLPIQWAPLFNFSKKVRGDVMGLSSDIMVRPGLRVVPMGWSSAVTLIQAAIRRITYEIAKVPRSGDVGKHAPMPDHAELTVLYLENFDEIRSLKKLLAEQEEGRPSQSHLKFIEACETLGLPRNEGKQLAGSLRGTLQGGEILGKEGILRHSYEKSQELLEISLGLLSMETVSEFCLRHWAGSLA